jgi:hypothetical protein
MRKSQKSSKVCKANNTKSKLSMAINPNQSKRFIIELSSEANFKKAERYQSLGYKVLPYGLTSVILFK